MSIDETITDVHNSLRDTYKKSNGDVNEFFFAVSLAFSDYTDFLLTKADLDVADKYKSDKKLSEMNEIFGYLLGMLSQSKINKNKKWQDAYLSLISKRMNG